MKDMIMKNIAVRLAKRRLKKYVKEGLVTTAEVGVYVDAMNTHGIQSQEAYDAAKPLLLKVYPTLLMK